MEGCELELGDGLPAGEMLLIWGLGWVGLIWLDLGVEGGLVEVGMGVNVLCLEGDTWDKDIDILKI